ncbi:hypothetical protein NicSoilE8_37700 [Arthrobacter sp. NicSoilE8]|nr:hypothetical protein NicSoilE8_37700 [Arthrobacter sp. NicSoilE8]
MEEGGERTLRFYRVSIPSKEAFDVHGKASKIHGETHIDISQNSLDEILGIIEKVKK